MKKDRKQHDKPSRDEIRVLTEQWIKQGNKPTVLIASDLNLDSFLNTADNSEADFFLLNQ